MFFCNNFARRLQKIVATCEAMCWFHGMLCSRARNPRFYVVHVSTKPRFRTKKRHQKIGDSVLCLRPCQRHVALGFYLEQDCGYLGLVPSALTCVFVNPSCKYVTKYKASNSRATHPVYDPGFFHERLDLMAGHGRRAAGGRPTS